MTRPVQAFVLVMLGAVLVRLTVTRDYLNYVQPGLGPLLTAAGVLFATLGIIGLVRDLGNPAEAHRAAARRRQDVRRRTHGPGADPRPTAAEHQHDDWHGHETGWWLCAPLFLLLVLPPPALGSYAAGRASAAVPAPAGERTFTPLPAADPVELTIRDYAMRAVWDHGRTLAGRRIVLIGFVDATLGEKWYLTRLHIVCCAADATPAKVQVVGSKDRLPTGQWVRITGYWLRSDPHDLDGRVARFQTVQAVPISRPEDPYE